MLRLIPALVLTALSVACPVLLIAAAVSALVALERRLECLP